MGDKKVRLQKFIASTGIASRRTAEELITTGRVYVNSTQVMKLGTSIDPQVDRVRVNGKDLVPVSVFRYVAVNKPEGATCTRAQYKSERTVYDIIPGVRDLAIAGRLDKDSGGLLLLTNDGTLVNQVTHPRYEHEKEYEFTTVRPLDQIACRALTHGVKLNEGYARFDQMSVVGPSTYRVVLHQGWKRQIRRMVGMVHGDLTRLTRIRINKLELGNLLPGEWREVQPADII
jgi:23S rRNA pseudouridine2605 synthase